MGKTAHRTSYFRVTDEKKYQKLTSGICPLNFFDFTEIRENVPWHAFGGYSSFEYYPEPPKKVIKKFKKMKPSATEQEINTLRFFEIIDNPTFFKELSKIIHPDDACVLMELNYHKLCYLIGHITVVMKGNVVCDSLDKMARKIITRQLGKEKAAVVKLHY